MTCVVEGSTDCSSVSRVLALLPVQISADEVERSVGAVDTGSAAAESTVEVVRSVEVAQTADVLFWVLSVLLLGQIPPSSYCK